jgi:hypothetical protein
MFLGAYVFARDVNVPNAGLILGLTVPATPPTVSERTFAV